MPEVVKSGLQIKNIISQDNIKVAVKSLARGSSTAHGGKRHAARAIPRPPRRNGASAQRTIRAAPGARAAHGDDAERGTVATVQAGSPINRLASSTRARACKPVL